MICPESQDFQSRVEAGIQTLVPRFEVGTLGTRLYLLLLPPLCVLVRGVILNVFGLSLFCRPGGREGSSMVILHLLMSINKSSKSKIDAKPVTCKNCQTRQNQSGQVHCPYSTQGMLRRICGQAQQGTAWPCHIWTQCDKTYIFDSGLCFNTEGRLYKLKVLKVTGTTYCKQLHYKHIGTNCDVWFMLHCRKLLDYCSIFNSLYYMGV